MQREEQPQDSCEHGALSVISAPEHMRGKRAAAALQEQQQFHAPGIVELCTGSASSQEAAPHHNRPVMRSGSENSMISLLPETIWITAKIRSNQMVFFKADKLQ